MLHEYSQSPVRKNYGMPGPVHHTFQTLYLAVIKIILIGGALLYEGLIRASEHVTFFGQVIYRSFLVLLYLSYVLFNLILVRLAILIQKKLKGIAIITLVCVLMGFITTYASAILVSSVQQNSLIEKITELRDISIGTHTKSLNLSSLISDQELVFLNEPSWSSSKSQDSTRTLSSSRSKTEARTLEEYSNLTFILHSLISGEVPQYSQHLIQDIDDALTELRNDVCVVELSTNTLEVLKHCADRNSFSKVLAEKLKWKLKTNDLLSFANLLI